MLTFCFTGNILATLLIISPYFFGVVVGYRF
jgi:hypothetical protein